MEKENRKIFLDLIRMMVLVPGVLIMLWSLKGGNYVLASIVLNISLIGLVYYSVQTIKLGMPIRATAVVLLVEVAFATAIAAFTVKGVIFGAILLVLSILIAFMAAATFIRPFLK